MVHSFEMVSCDTERNLSAFISTDMWIKFTLKIKQNISIVMMSFYRYIKLFFNLIFGILILIRIEFTFNSFDFRNFKRFKAPLEI